MRKSKLANLALSDNGFLFDTTSGHTFTLNQTGTLTLRMLINNAHLSEIVEQITDRFEVTDETARRDIEQFLGRLRELRIVNGDQEEN